MLVSSIEDALALIIKFGGFDNIKIEAESLKTYLMLFH